MVSKTMKATYIVSFASMLIGMALGLELLVVIATVSLLILAAVVEIKEFIRDELSDTNELNALYSHFGPSWMHRHLDEAGVEKPFNEVAENAERAGWKADD